MHTHPSARRDFAGMEQRRKRAARLFADGRLIASAIARKLEVSCQSVSRWYSDWRRGGAAALRGAGRAGRKPRLNPKQLRQIEKELRRGAPAPGVGPGLWTVPPVREEIEQFTGGAYPPR